MLEIGKRKSPSGREIEYQQVKWRRVSKEEELKNKEEYLQKKRSIQEELKTPERKLQTAMFVESRSPTPENSHNNNTYRHSPLNIKKNYFSSKNENQRENKWEERIESKNKENKVVIGNQQKVVINKNQILKGIEGKIKRLTPSKSFNNSIFQESNMNMRNNSDLNYNSTQVLPPQNNIFLNKNTPQLLQVKTDPYGNFITTDRSLSPYQRPDQRQSSKSPKNQAEKFYIRTSHQNPSKMNKENLPLHANLKLIKKPTLQNNLIFKDKERNAVKLQEQPSYVEDSSVYIRESRDIEMNTRVTKQGIVITGKSSHYKAKKTFEKLNEVYQDFKEGAIIPVNSLEHEDPDDFVDFDELNTPNVQKHFSLHQSKQEDERSYFGEKVMKHGASYNYTFKGRESSKRGGIESGYNNEWFNDENDAPRIYSQKKSYDGGF